MKPNGPATEARLRYRPPRPFCAGQRRIAHGLCATRRFGRSIRSCRANNATRLGRSQWRTTPDCAESHSKVLALFDLVESTSLKPSVQKVIQAGALANEVREVETPKLPFMTLIKDQHEELDRDVRCIIDFIARGTFGEVYRAFNLGALRQEAVKVVRLVNKQGLPLDDAERIERLRSQLDEAEIMLELGLHPNLVAIRGVLMLRAMQDANSEAVADNLYIFMDYVEGGMTLARCIEIVDMDLETKIFVSREVANGLVYIQQRFPNSKFIHWDVKP